MGPFEGHDSLNWAGSTAWEPDSLLEQAYEDRYPSPDLPGDREAIFLDEESDPDYADYPDDWDDGEGDSNG